jgi:hypothetical protein
MATAAKTAIGRRLTSFFGSKEKIGLFADRTALFRVLRRLPQT